MSGLLYLAVMHDGVAHAAAWDAFLADVPMTWLEDRP